MSKYLELRNALEQSPADQDEILAEFVNCHTTKADELKGDQIALWADEVVVDEDFIEAAVHFKMVGRAESDEDGPYQDEDGDSYDLPEYDYSFRLRITEKSVTWTKE